MYRRPLCIEDPFVPTDNVAMFPYGMVMGAGMGGRMGGMPVMIGGMGGMPMVMGGIGGGGIGYSVPMAMFQRQQVREVFGCRYCNNIADSFAEIEHSSSCPRYVSSSSSYSSVSVSSSDSRDYHLDSNVMTLYHQTNEQNARSILASQSFRCSSSGMAGPGVYFATSKSDTDHKANNKGVVLQCRVRLGRVRRVTQSGDSSISFSSLLSSGYDSVEIPRSGGTEYVVYNSDQVSSISRC